MSDFAEAALEQLGAGLSDEADPDRAVKMARYMRDQFVFFGVTSAQVKALMRPIIADSRSVDGDAIIDFASLAWRRDEREYQYAAALLLRRRAGALTADQIGAVRSLITTKSWWDTVDTLAAHTVGPMVMTQPALGAVMDQWVNDADMWLRRTAILHQLGYREHTDQERLFRYCLARASETEFFIRKAIGWALRQYGRVAPDAVRTFVLDHDDVWSGLTRREALKHLA